MLLFATPQAVWTQEFPTLGGGVGAFFSPIRLRFSTLGKDEGLVGLWFPQFVDDFQNREEGRGVVSQPAPEGCESQKYSRGHVDQAMHSVELVAVTCPVTWPVANCFFFSFHTSAVPPFNSRHPPGFQAPAPSVKGKP